MSVPRNARRMHEVTLKLPEIMNLYSIYFLNKTIPNWVQSPFMFSRVVLRGENQKLS
jgi:hypothetical protein